MDSSISSVFTYKKGRREGEKLKQAQSFTCRLIDMVLFGKLVCFSEHIQWNLRTVDTLGLIVLSLVERLSLSRR